MPFDQTHSAPVAAPAFSQDQVDRVLAEYAGIVTGHLGGAVQPGVMTALPPIDWNMLKALFKTTTPLVLVLLKAYAPAAPWDAILAALNQSVDASQQPKPAGLV